MFDKPKKNASCEGKIIKKKIHFLPLLTSPYVTIGFYQRKFQDEHSLLYALSWEVIIFRVSLSLGLATTFTR
jgi:hypothetical protein